MTFAADVLWDFDEAGARKLLRDAYSETFTPEFKKSDETGAAAVRLTEMIQRIRADSLAVVTAAESVLKQKSL